MTDLAMQARKRAGRNSNRVIHKIGAYPQGKTAKGCGANPQPFYSNGLISGHGRGPLPQQPVIWLLRINRGPTASRDQQESAHQDETPGNQCQITA